MGKFSSPPKFIATVHQFHQDGLQARVQNADGELWVTNGVNEGCILTQTLFSMLFSVMLMGALQDSDTGFAIRYRFHSNLFNIRRLLDKTCRQMCLMSYSMQMIWIRMPTQR